jgi:signal transduction histidine kinase
MATMLRKLRVQLTLFYFLAALAIVVLVGGISYSLLRFYLYDATDDAMEVKMALIMRQYELSLPEEIAQAEQNWLENKGQSQPPFTPTSTFTPTPTSTFTPTPTSTPTPVQAAAFESEEEDDDDESELAEHKSNPIEYSESEDDGDDEENDERELVEHTVKSIEYSESEEEIYDEELAPVFVLPLNANNELIAVVNLPVAPITQDKSAAQAALMNGSDLRTIRLEDGSRARLLTYRVAVLDGPATLQVGRLLRDQDRVLNQYLIGLLILSGVSTAVLGLGSWWLSGRSLGPAQQAWNHQQAFVSNASHELRTPLTLIRATADYARRQHPKTESSEHLQDILQECDYMNSLVDDLLMLSRLDSQRLELKNEVVDLALLLKDIKEQFSKLTYSKDITLVMDHAEGVILGDPIRLRQVLLILLDNAFRFTPLNGSIHLATQKKGKRHQILIRDNGVGISPEHLPHIFERFYQVNNKGIDDSRNNGLGLSIAKGLVEAQGGTIMLQSQVDKGTEVIISLRTAK